MISYRIFLFSFLSVSWLFLCGLDNSVVTDTPINQAQKVIVEAGAVAATSSPKDASVTAPLDSKTIVKSPKRKKRALRKRKMVEEVEDNKPTQHDAPEKTLDLSIPLIHVDSVDLKTDKKKDETDPPNSFFDPKSKKQPRSLELNGNFLMSPEPEVERKKTLDGAGISINVKPD